MKLLFDFFPIILFFAAFRLRGIFVATAVAIAASICQVAYSYWRHRKIEPMMLVSLGVLLVFGGFTLLLRNEMFIKWKPTILYWIFSATLVIAALVFKKNLLQAMLQRQLSLPAQVWHRLNLVWAVFFALLGTLNLFVAYHFSTSTWVTFKLFGLLGCLLAFMVFQAIYLSAYMPKE